MRSALRRWAGPLFSNNPVTVQSLGICSALAVTTSVVNALTMSLALTAVIVSSNVIVSLLRHRMPDSVRLLVEITIIASLVIVVDLLLKAYFFEISQRLSVFVSLIVTNCVVMGRAEAWARHHGPASSALDGLANGFGYSGVLLIVATVRELFGQGSLLGRNILPLASEGGWFEPLGFMQSAPSAFFILGLLVWAARLRLARERRVEELHPLRRLDEALR